MLKSNWLLKVRNNDTWVIFKKVYPSFMLFIPLTLALFVVCFILSGIILHGDWIELFKRIPKKYLAAMAMASLVLPVPFILFLFNRISKARLQLQGDTVYVRGVPYSKIIEKQLNVAEFASVEFGKEPKALDRFYNYLNPFIGYLKNNNNTASDQKNATADIKKECKPGTVIFHLRDGKKMLFSYFDLAFDWNSVLDFVMELRRRGVEIRGIRL